MNELAKDRGTLAAVEKPVDLATVACVACQRVIRARRNGHPYRHTPKTRLGGAKRVARGRE